MWKNNLEPGRLLITIWRMCIACWILKSTDTHSEYVTGIAFPLQQQLQERASLLRLYVHCLPCLKFIVFVRGGHFDYSPQAPRNLR